MERASYQEDLEQERRQNLELKREKKYLKQKNEDDFAHMSATHDNMVTQMHSIGLHLMKKQQHRQTGISWIDKQKNSLYRTNTLYVLNQHPQPL